MDRSTNTEDRPEGDGLPTPAGKKKVDAQAVKDLLRERFCAPEWALLYEVRNRTGYGGTERYADAVAVNLWPSRGLSVHGFEVKVSRSDWLTELKNPAKSASVQKYCDFWWLVVGDKSIVQAGELPETWGLLVTEGKEKLKLVCRKEAPKLEAAPLDRLFLCSMLRRAAETVAQYEAGRNHSVEFEKGFNEGREAAREEKSWQHKDLERTVEELELRIKTFQEASGVRINSWDAGNIGRAVKLVLKHYHRPVDYTRTIEQSMRPLEVLLSAMGALKKTFELLEKDNEGQSD